MKNNLSSYFAKSVEKFPMRPALEINDCIYNYEELGKISGGIGKVIKELNISNDYIALLSYRSLTAYSATLAILSAGYAYVPFHPDIPVERNLSLLKASRAGVMIVGKECEVAFNELLKVIDINMTFIMIGFTDTKKIISDNHKQKFILIDDLVENRARLEIENVNNDELAYLLFTSGSTGVPKGVPVSHKNICSYIRYMTDNYSFDEYDRFSQMFELVFDPSIHDMFVCWSVGACLCVPSQKDLLLAVNYIQRSEITIWFSVPSVVMLIERYGRLEVNAFPAIRHSFFSGEALPVNLVNKWISAAPNSVVDNLYGPTEATITISSYSWNKDSSGEEAVNGIVPIGKIYEGQSGIVIDAAGNEVETGNVGELCLSGTQVTSGYLNNAEQTKSQFVSMPESSDNFWYKTGDLVKQDDAKCFYYLGRIDNQVKIQGNRIELSEVDMVVREVASVEMVASLAWPYVNNTATGIVSIVCKMTNLDKDEIIEHCKSKLPRIMVPKKIYFIDEMPLNINGKIDRNQLKKMLADETLR